MALLILNNTGNSYGQLDGYDGLASTLLGGEVAHIVAYGTGGSDKHAKDVDDGYVVNGPSPLQNVRPVVSTTFAAAENTDMLFLTDDGTTNYGTIFGTVVGGTTGQLISGLTSLGPSTMSGSGKVTLWQNTGLYGVTLDAVDTATDGLVSTNNTLTIGKKLTFGANGKLTPIGSTLAGAFPSSANTVAVARLVEFTSGDGLVNTPRSLTRVGISGGMQQFKYVVINWNPPSA